MKRTKTGDENMPLAVDIETDGVNVERVTALCVALESGRYPQTTGTLRDHDGYCCLGVACDVMTPDRWWRYPDDLDGFTYLEPRVDPVELDDLGLDDDGHDKRDRLMRGNGSSAELTDEVCDWYGFDSSDPVVEISCSCVDDRKQPCITCGNKGFRAVPLTDLNDMLSWDLPRIASAIRHTYLDPDGVPAIGHSSHLT